MTKTDLTWDEAYGRMDDRSVPVKVSGQPVARSSREILEKLKEEEREQS